MWSFATSSDALVVWPGATSSFFAPFVVMPLLLVVDDSFANLCFSPTQQRPEADSEL